MMSRIGGRLDIYQVTGVSKRFAAQMELWWMGVKVENPKPSDVWFIGRQNHLLPRVITSAHRSRR